MLTLAIPSKGRLKDNCNAWFTERGVVMEQTAGARGYRASFAGMPDVEVMLQVLYGDMEEVTSRIKLRDDGLELPVPEFVDNIAAITLGQQGLVKAGVSGPWMRMWANSY